MSVFTDRYKGVPKTNRNNFDLSFTNHATFKMGYLYPVFCKEVIPNESIRVKPTFGLRLDPTLFPLQTKLRADLHFFYVRNRNLWNQWENYMSNALPTGHTFPYIAQGSRFFKTGSLSDYLGVPTTMIGDLGSSYLGYCYTNKTNLTTQCENTFCSQFQSKTGRVPSSVRLPNPLGFIADTALTSWNVVSQDLDYSVFSQVFVGNGEIKRDTNYVCYTIYDDCFVPSSLQASEDFVIDLKSNVNFVGCDIQVWFFSNPHSSGLDGISSKTKVCGFCKAILAADGSVSGLDYDAFNNIVTDAISKFGSVFFGIVGSCTDFGLSSPTSYYYNSDKPCVAFPYSVSFPLIGSYVREASELDTSDHPFCNGETPISALPYRAYESIYNTYYRDIQNDPLTDALGQPMYNQFVTNKTGGADSTPYKLERRRWEADQFVSAMQSPQQGIAPLVGIQTNFSSGTATLQFQSADPTDPDAVTQVEVDIDTDGETISGIRSATGVNQATLTNLMNDISSGISINSLRNVNALQRWLEKNIYLGYRYKDQIKAHFGVDARFDELDMPEFIGGTSAVFNMQSIRQTAPTSDGVLGDYAGFGELFKNAQHSINHFFDEWGYVIGILSIHPVPTYCQVLPKHFTKVHNQLDFYSTEFAHIGFQPIPYAELCPLQAVGENAETFGYQKAWYDYMASLDEAHGQFRTTLKDYLLMRLFNSKPSLTNPDFLYCDEESLNDVFPVTQDDTDHIKGIIYFDCQAKLPISKYGMPRLE